LVVIGSSQDLQDVGKIGVIGECELADLRNHFRPTVRKFRQKLVGVGYKLFCGELPGQLMHGGQSCWLLLCGGLSWLSGLSWLLGLDAQRHHWNRDHASQ
jgi:hypothetical protein